MAEELFEHEPASAGVEKLGATSWAAYSVLDETMVGLALFASDAAGDVRYVMLVNQRVAADGRTQVVLFEVDERGERLGPVDAKTADALRSDLVTLQAALRHVAAKPRTREQQCAVAVAATALGLVGGLAAGYFAGAAIGTLAALVGEQGMKLAILKLGGVGTSAGLVSEVSFVGAYAAWKASLATCRQ